MCRQGALPVVPETCRRVCKRKFIRKAALLSWAVFRIFSGNKAVYQIVNAGALQPASVVNVREIAAGNGTDITSSFCINPEQSAVRVQRNHIRVILPLCRPSTLQCTLLRYDTRTSTARQSALLRQAWRLHLLPSTTLTPVFYL